MFRKILVANRGEIALRVIRACKEMGISTVAVHSDVDRESLHVKMADESVCIGPAESVQSYLSIPKIMSAADITGVDAIHPGYGFLAENAEFARVCQKCGIQFIGPTAANIELMGDKLRARNAMLEAGLPLLPCREIETDDPKQISEAIESIGLPVIVKATAGGGGKGIKIIRSMENFQNTVKTAQSEAMAAFGNSKVYLERFLEKARHIEFQVAGDQFGKVIHLGERDCSIQRRYQKVLEEAPSTLLSTRSRDKIGNQITEAIRKVDYVNVGTVEFLMEDEQKFYFLEMNTRIQVEHPITEEVTGIDLVKLQIRLAAGESLPYKQEDINFHGHAIEMRINAEDPEKFYPSSGEITGFHIPGGIGVRVDSGAYDGYVMSPYYDSMIAKLIVYGTTRKEAISKAQTALDEFLVEGIQTNIPLHKKILRDQKFINGKTHIRYLDNLLNLNK